MSRPEIVDQLQAMQWVGEERRDDEVLIYVIHDGRQLPRHLLGDRSEDVLARPEIQAAYLRERDWGANFVASHLVKQLGISGYLQVNLARFVMDYGRFPGDSDARAEHLLRYCFNPPFSELLTQEQKYDLLERHYDVISQGIARRAMGKKITMSIHTYDAVGASGSKRAEVSLLSRLLEQRPDSTLDPSVFDPLFPAILCEDSTCHRALIYQMLLNLERGGHRTAINYPYLMPAGSLEIRGQAWFFFRRLRSRFYQELPAKAREDAYRLVWRMLLDVDHRSADAARLRGFLHHYHGAPKGQKKLFLKAREAYKKIKGFLEANHLELVDSYRYSKERPSCLGIEVRKDLLCDLDADRGRINLRSDADFMAHDIARHIAEAIRAFLEEEEMMADLVGSLARLRSAGGALDEREP